MIAFLQRIYRALILLAPPAERRAWNRDAITTFRAVCLTARTRGGAALLVTGLRELADLLRVVIRLRLRGTRSANTDELDPDGPAPLGTSNKAPGGRIARTARDVRMARSLRAGGTTSAIAILTLALGIGVNAAIFSVLDSVLWRRVPFRDAAQLVELTNFDQHGKFSYSGMSPALVLAWRGQADLFTAVEAYESRSVVFDNGAGAEMVAGAIVTPGVFRMLGVAAARGRGFTDDDGRSGTTARAVVSDTFWRERLGSAPDVSGRDVRIDNRPITVIGVMPDAFRFPDGQTEIWLPYDVAQTPADVPPARMLTPVGRLAAGVTADRAAVEVRARGERLNREAGGPPDLSAMLETVADYVDRRTERSLWVLCGAVGFLFLIVCANVANLALSRSLTRARDLATCAAMGASPADLVRTALIEQLLLAGAGAAGGLIVAAGALRTVIAALPETMTARTLNPIDLDVRTLGFMLAAGVAAALLFGLTPAFMAARTSVAATLGSGGRASTGTRTARRFRATLAVVEVAVSIILLVGSALMARSFVKLATADPGFDTRDLISVRIGFPSTGYADADVRERAALDLVERLRHSGGATGATVGGLPLEMSNIAYGTFEIEGRTDVPARPTMVPLREVPADYFSTLGLPIRSGRGFATNDATGSVVVNERFVATFVPSGSPIGRRFRVNRGPWRTIVGVARNTDAATDDGPKRMEIYAPIGGGSDALVPSRPASLIADYKTFLVRAPQGEAAFAALRAAVHGYDPALVVWKMTLVDRLLADAIARPRVVFLMMSVFAALGLVLATAGLYGVLSCLVAQRRREIGVRLALGASPRQMRWLVLGSGLGLTAAGVAIGLGVAWPLVRLMRTLLYEVDPFDPVAIAGSAAVLGLTALVACWWPAKDAMQVSPVELLRGE